jgi:peptide/nickel transport system substrate-binding protein
MAMATNKQYIVDQYYFGLAEPGSTAIPPVNSFWHYEPNATEMIEYDIEAAKNLLTEAGYIDGPDSDTIRECTASSYAVQEGWVVEGKPLVYEMLLRREYPEEKDIADYLQTEWAKIGIQVNYIILDEAELSTQVYYYKYDTMIWYWSADIDPNYQLYVLTEAAWGGWNDNMYANPLYEANYTAAVQEMDRDQRKVYVDNCQRVHYLDIAYIIMAYAYQTYAWRDDTFTGWGDWAADPGRSMDNFWMGNPLFFDLVPIGGDDTEIPWLAIIATVGVIAAIAVAVVFLKRRGKKKEEEMSESPLGE